MSQIRYPSADDMADALYQELLDCGYNPETDDTMDCEGQWIQERYEPFLSQPLVQPNNQHI